MKKLPLICSIFLALPCLAQLPEDALRLSWYTPGGTAREQAIGGSMGSLGGEISSGFINPAGLGFYKKGEVVVSPSFLFAGSNSNYRGTPGTGSPVNRLNLGTSGLVFTNPMEGGGSMVLSFAVNRMANFNSSIQYQGQNNYSSFSEQYAEEFSSSGLSINDAIADAGISYGTRMALYTYLIDTATVNGVQQVISLPEKAGLLNQSNNIRTSGGITEVSLALAATSHEKWYLGAALGIPIVSYTRNSTFTETDATGNTNNNFAFSTYQESYKSTGVGANLKLGAIFRLFDSWRLGLAVHSPTFYQLNDRLTASMKTNTEKYTSAPGGLISISSDSLDQATGTSPGTVKYDLASPWKFILSGSYIFGQDEDREKQKGFLTADIAYVTVSSSRFSSADNTVDDSYFNNVNSIVKSYYKGSFDMHLGGELKFNNLAARAGIAYYTGPYREKDLKADRLLISFGLGYRNKGVFIDLAYVENFYRDVNFPYRLADKANTYATIKEESGTILLTVGFKFP
jgi:hypothetical protein